MTRARSIAEMVVSALHDHPDRVFLRWSPDVVWTYAEAAVRICAIARKLEALGAGFGDHVVVHTHAMVPSILFDLACACTGIVFTPIETTSLPAVLDVVKRTGARAVLTTPDRTGPYGVPIIHEDGRGAASGDATEAIAYLSRAAERVRGDSVYMLQPTSGTTGGSKLVIRNHTTFVRAAPLLGRGLARDSVPPGRILMVPALTHGMGQYLLGIAMSVAGELCVTSKIDVHADIAEIRALDPTFIALTPRVVRSLFQQVGGAEGCTRLFGPSATTMLTGGAAPDPELILAIQRTGLDVLEGYGASEFSVVAVSRPGGWRPDMLGHVVDDVELRLTDEGELLAKTPGMFVGYHGNPEGTRAAFTEDGFYRTGDRVELGAGGELRYIGRLVDSFNLFDGSHVAPGPIEDALTLRLPWLDQVILLGDQRPFIVGLAVLQPALRDAWPSDELRARIAREVGEVCSGFEYNAKIKRLAILPAPLPEALYQVVGHGKVRRMRAEVIAQHAALVDALYAGAERASIVDIP